MRLRDHLPCMDVGWSFKYGSLKTWRQKIREILRDGHGDAHAQNKTPAEHECRAGEVND